MKYTFALAIWLSAMTLSAQETFTDKLQQVVESAGRIVLHQEKNITDLVNGAKSLVSKPSQKKQIDSTLQDSTQTAVTDSVSLGIRVKTTNLTSEFFRSHNPYLFILLARLLTLR